MKKTIRVDLYDEDDLYQQYNDEKVSKELVKYLVDAASKYRKEEVKVVIYNRFGGAENCADMIKEALLEELESNDYKFHLTNIRQLAFFVAGAIALIVSTFIDIEVIKEIVLIGAWVLLWEMVELEIVDDISNRKKKRVLKKLLASEFEEYKID